MSATPPPPISQSSKQSDRYNWPAWMRQLPRFRYRNRPNPNFQLIPQNMLQSVFAEQGVSAEALDRLMQDYNFLSSELIPSFQELDFEAWKALNQYRQSQVLYILLAGAATLISSLQAILINQTESRTLIPILGFATTMIALLTSLVAPSGGNESQLSVWGTTRQIAEGLRREFYRYLMNVPPYDAVEGYQRERLLRQRVARIKGGEILDAAAAEDEDTLDSSKATSNAGN